MLSKLLLNLRNGFNIEKLVAFEFEQVKKDGYLVAIPCQEYTINGETYTAIGTVYDHSKLDSMLNLGGYDGSAYLFMLDDDGNITYTNQKDDIFFRNYSLLKHLKSNHAITEKEFDSLNKKIAEGKKGVELLEKDNRGNCKRILEIFWFVDERQVFVCKLIGKKELFYKDMMKITYINHSGFLIETKDCYYIFDYYKGELPLLDKKKEVIVFCSHFHKDHFNPVIFEILDDMSMTYQAILAKDIRKRKHLPDMKITYVYHDQTYNPDNGTQVDTLLSNDSGVAFIVKTKEGTIYHAGDLNDWYWDGEPNADNQRLTSAYRAEIRKIKGMHFDAAFVPLDPRQGNHYADGILYFLKNVDCNVIFPMHYWNDANVIKRFITEYPQYKSRIKNTECAKGEEL